ncbi:MAG: response regulator, partial [Pseudomonadota bacterium]
AFSIEEASRVINEEMPNLIIADWTMPDGSTHDFIASIRAMHPPVEPCIIYLVTENNAEDITAALNAGANDYVLKPFERTVLQEKVKKIADDLPAFATAE